MTKLTDAVWEWRNAFSAWKMCLRGDSIDRLAFWEEVSIGWYREYIYPYDDGYNPWPSRERVSRLGAVRYGGG